MSKIAMLPAAALLLGLAACDPYNPADRALGGPTIGVGTGAAVGVPTGAGLGAATGVLTTPAPPPPRY
jgi:hypothetical protein